MHGPFEEIPSRNLEPCILVIFGATGDLTSKKLIPALYNLLRDALLPSSFVCVGFSRKPKTEGQFVEEMKQAVIKFSRTKPIDEDLWDQFKRHLHYHCGDLSCLESYQALKSELDHFDQKLGTKGNRIFYFATPPSYFPVIVENLYQAGLIYEYKKHPDPWSRVIIEKPFGRDLSSALALQQHLLKFLDEKQIYRIDHYLGKETVQNLLILRFANSIFEPLWNKEYIDHFQITVAEDQGIGSRGKFWEEAGLLRDIIQNHMIQLLTLVTMEAPSQFEADAIRDEKVKVLHHIRPLSYQDTIRGQYGANADPNFQGYRQEKDVHPSSSVETYAAVKLYIDNHRWEGVPFYLRAGKALSKRKTEIAVIFKKPLPMNYQDQIHQYDSNVLTIRIQPNEGASLEINCKVPGSLGPVCPVKMDFHYGTYFGKTSPEAYERLICDAILGDSTLFAREDEVMESWKLFTPVLQMWEQNPPMNFPNYPIGSEGPQEAQTFIELSQRSWRHI